MNTMTELDPANLSEWDLRVYIAEERAGGWEPTHLVVSLDPDVTVCERYAGNDPGGVYGLTQNRAIWERWYGVGWGCQACAEVLHA